MDIDLPAIVEDFHRAIVFDRLEGLPSVASVEHLAVQHGGWAVLAVELELATLLDRDVRSFVTEGGVGTDIRIAASRIVDLFRP